jgi:hypothetical protein
MTIASSRIIKLPLYNMYDQPLVNQFVIPSRSVKIYLLKSLSGGIGNAHCISINLLSSVELAACPNWSVKVAILIDSAGFVNSSAL